MRFVKVFAMTAAILFTFWIVLFIPFESPTQIWIGESFKVFSNAIAEHEKVVHGGHRGRSARLLAEAPTDSTAAYIPPELLLSEHLYSAELPASARPRERSLAASPVALFPPSRDNLVAGSQCGGIGGLCPIEVVCKDAPWADYECPFSLYCGRRSAWIWRCLKAGEPDGPYKCPVVLTAFADQTTSSSYCSGSRHASAPTASARPQPQDLAAAIPPEQEPALVPAPQVGGQGFNVSAWYQGTCGGLGFTCPLTRGCGDLQWASCPSNSRCERHNQWLWQCSGPRG